MFRGNKLWEGHRMILPEHRAAMLEAQYQEERRFERPELDEEMLAEMSQTLAEAIQMQRTVTLVVYDEFGPEEIVMLPKRVDQTSRRIIGWSRLAEKQIGVPLWDVLDVQTE